MCMDGCDMPGIDKHFMQLEFHGKTYAAICDINKRQYEHENNSGK